MEVGMSPQDVEYYERRALEEREKAKLTNDTAVARVHVDMAEEYERRARGGTPLTAGPTCS
jgi:hypothetical protein